MDMKTGRLETVEDLFGLSDKGILITGATSLISIWTARLLLRVGARVVMTDRIDAEAIEDTFRRVAQERDDPGLDLTGQVTLIGKVDIRNRKPEEATKVGSGDTISVFELVKKTVAHLGTIDVLINMAGGQEPVPAAFLSTKVFKQTVDRILFGTWNVIHEVFEQCMRDNGGRILTVTADCEQGYPLMPGMGAARNALTSLHKALSVEWSPNNITTCIIAPGATDTHGLRRYPNHENITKVGVRAANMKRLFQAREIAWLFLVMASPWSCTVNGHNLVANGGDTNITPLFLELMRTLE